MKIVQTGGANKKTGGGGKARGRKIPRFFKLLNYQFFTA